MSRRKRNVSFGGPPRSKGYNRTLGLRNPDPNLNGPVIVVEERLIVNMKPKIVRTVTMNIGQKRKARPFD